MSKRRDRKIADRVSQWCRKEAQKAKVAGKIENPSEEENRLRREMRNVLGISDFALSDLADPKLGDRSGDSPDMDTFG